VTLQASRSTRVSKFDLSAAPAVCVDQKPWLVYPQGRIVSTVLESKALVIDNEFESSRKLQST
jgi:hypothetical protein